VQQDFKNINTEFKRLHRFKGKPQRISEDVEKLAIQGQFNCFSITSPTTQKAESRKQKAESRKQKAESRKQKAESRKQKAESRKRTSKFNLETSKSCRLLLN
jgi:hypothetical protein